MNIQNNQNLLDRYNPTNSKAIQTHKVIDAYIHTDKQLPSEGVLDALRAGL